MKKGRTAGIFILMMAVLGFFFVSHAADKKENQTKSLTIKTVTPSKTKVKGKKPLKFKPDLVVEDISLDKGFITFTLKNNGPGFLSDDDHKQGEVKVSYKGRVSKDTYPFSKVDPKRKLKKPDGSVTYKTKEKLTSRQEVIVSIYFGKTTLKPDKKISLKRTLGKKQPGKLFQCGVPIPGLKRTLGKKQPTLVQKPEMVPKLLDDGIRMPSPQEGYVFHRGGSLSINYRFSWDDVAAGGDIVFSLRLDENGDEVVSTTVENTDPNLPPGAFHEVVLVVPGDVPYGEYHILASHSASGAVGESDVFSIQGIGEGGPGHPTSWEIRVVTPGRMPTSWPRGSTQTIAWRIDGDYPSERAFLVQLKRGADTVLTIPSERPIWHRSSESYSLSWPIPTDLPPASDYRILIADRNGLTEGISESEFSITGPIEVWHHRSLRYIGNPTKIRWSLAPGSGVSRVRIVLVDSRGEEVLQIHRLWRADAGECTWYVGANHQESTDGRWVYKSGVGPSLMGSSYAVRVINADDPSDYGEGNYFDMIPADLRVWTSEYSCRHGRRIYWESSQLHDSVRIKIRCGFVPLGCRYGTSVDDPYGSYGYGYIALSENAHPSGNFCWEFGESSDGRYPTCPCFCADGNIEAYIMAWPEGFRYYYTSRSSRFDLPSDGCTAPPSPD